MGLPHFVMLYKILEYLEVHGRAPVTELAELCDEDAKAVRRVAHDAQDAGFGIVNIISYDKHAGRGQHVVCMEGHDQFVVGRRVTAEEREQARRKW